MRNRTPSLTFVNSIGQGYNIPRKITDMTLTGTYKTLTLWQRIIRDLVGIFDAHGVCAAVAQAIAEETQLLTVVALSDPVRQDYDVWICKSTGQMNQARWQELGPTIQHFVEKGESAIIDKTSIPPGELVRTEVWQLPHANLCLAPLPYPTEESVLMRPGAIILVDPDRDDPIISEALNDLATQVTAFLDRSYLRQQTHQQEVEFGMVSDISYSLTATLDLEQIFTQVTDAIRRALGTETISIGLIDPDTKEILFVETLLGPLFHEFPTVKLQPGQGIAGWVADSGQAAVVNDVSSDRRFYSGVDTASGFETRSILCVPLLVEKRVIGVLEAINKHNGKFDKNDLRLVQAISGPLAVAIENARLHGDVLSEKRRIETIFDNMSEGLVTTSISGHIREVNDSFLTLLGQGHDVDLIGKPIEQVVKTSPTDFGTYLNELSQAKDEFPQLACDISQVNGEFVPVLVSGAPITNQGGVAAELVFVFSDLRLVREVERMRDDFFNNIVHELHTPLASILMYARLLREGKTVDNPEKEERFLGVIERESNRLQKMVRQMLLLAKLEAQEVRGTYQSVKLGIILDQVLPPLVDRATVKGLTFEQRIEPDLPSVLGNEETLQMVITNLLENAIKFTPAGAVRFSVSRKNDNIYVDISDEGIGIPEEALPNLYQRFYRARTAVERGIAGTGLGLYMVKEGLERYGGTIETFSEEGVGTTITVSLPIASD